MEQNIGDCMNSEEDERLSKAVELAEKLNKKNRKERNISEALAIANEIEKSEDIFPEPEKPELEEKIHMLRINQKSGDISLEQELFVDEKAIKAEITRKNRIRRILITIGIICITVNIFVFLAFIIIKVRGKEQLKKEVDDINPELMGQDISYEDNVVYHDGRKYIYDEDNILILIMGIDDKRDSDANMLVILNPEKKRIKCININRDCISAVKVYNPAGEYITTSNMQIALAYAYGTSEKKSCELMTDVISNMLYQLPIHGYISLNMMNIADINDVIGGVAIVPIETINENIIKGQEIKLVGNLALKYVTERDSKSGSIGTNSDRMARQIQYIYAWYNQFVETIEGQPSKIIDIYKQLNDNITTNLDFSEITYLADVIVECNMTDADIYTLPGHYERSNYYDEYIIDDDELVEFILDIFYTEVE
ncbi:MAG: LCP family protein [Coprococcus sp.]